MLTRTDVLPPYVTFGDYRYHRNLEVFLCIVQGAGRRCGTGDRAS
jgi:hypothetical protein